MSNFSLKYAKKVPIIFALTFLALLSVSYLNLSNGSFHLSVQTMTQSLFHYESSNIQQQVFHELRLPRLLGGLFIGASLATSGALMQVATRNPLADSGLLGINSGAAFFLTLCFAFFPKVDASGTLFFALFGAGLTSVGILWLSNLPKQQSPIRIVLVGVAISSFLTALSQGLALFFNINRDLAFWYIGGVASLTWKQLALTLPLMSIALIGSLFLSGKLSMLGMGDDIAQSLGASPQRIRFVSMILVTLLAGTAVSLVGSISFLGLITPYIARYLMGHDYRKALPYTMLLGALLAVSADLLSHFINPPQEVPFGAIIALIGAPFFIYLARTNASGGTR